MVTPGAPAQPDRRTLLLTELGLLLMALIWGLNFAVLKYGTTVIEPIAYNAIRMAVGTVALLGVAVATSARPSWADIRKLMLLGVLGHGVYQGLFINGLARTRAGTAALVVAASPAVIAIVGRALGVEQITRRAVAGIAISFVGIAIVVLGSSQGGEGGTSVTGERVVRFHDRLGLGTAIVTADPKPLPRKVQRGQARSRRRRRRYGIGRAGHIGLPK